MYRRLSLNTIIFSIGDLQLRFAHVCRGGWELNSLYQLKWAYLLGLGQSNGKETFCVSSLKKGNTW